MKKKAAGKKGDMKMDYPKGKKGKKGDMKEDSSGGKKDFFAGFKKKGKK